MNGTILKEFEQISDILASPPNVDAYNKANESMNAFAANGQYMLNLSVLENSSNQNALFFAAISLK
jgi:hypothetical protein